MRKITAWVLVSALGFVSITPASELDVGSIVDHLDRLYRSRTSRAEVEMTVTTPHWQRVLRMHLWTEGMDKTLIRIIAPEKERGVATLRLGKSMWNYLPRVNKVIKIPPSMMMGSWMGSDFTNDDLVDEYTFKEDYRFRIVHPQREDTSRIYIECIPKEDRAIVWGKIVAEVRRSDWSPLKETFFDEKGNAMRVMEFKNMERMGGRSIPTLLEMIPLKKQGHKTTIRYIDVEFDIPLNESIFSLRSLRSGR